MKAFLSHTGADKDLVSIVQEGTVKNGRKNKDGIEYGFAILGGTLCEKGVPPI